MVRKRNVIEWDELQRRMLQRSTGQSDRRREQTEEPDAIDETDPLDHLLDGNFDEDDDDGGGENFEFDSDFDDDDEQEFDGFDDPHTDDDASGAAATHRKGKDELGQWWQTLESHPLFSVPLAPPDSGWDLSATRFAKLPFPVAVDDPPKTADEVLPWVSRNGLIHLASATLQQLQKWCTFSYYRHDPQARLIDVLTSRQGVQQSHFLKKDTSFLRAVRAYLNFGYMRKHQQAHRAKVWREIDISPAVNRVAAAAIDVLEHIYRFSDADKPLMFNRAELLIPTGFSGFGIEFEQHHEEVWPLIHFPNENTIGIHCACSHLRAYPCLHVRVLLEWLLDVLASKKEPAHKALVDALNTPPWQQAIRLLTAAVHTIPRAESRFTEETKRLAWRIYDSTESEWIPFEPVLQTLGKNGKWSRGRRIQEAEWFKEFDAQLGDENPLARHYFHLNLAAYRYHHIDIQGRDLREQLVQLLPKLATQSRVYLGSKGTVPIQVVPARVSLSVNSCPDGVALGVLLGDMELRGQEIQSHIMDRRHLYYFDESAFRFIIGTIDPVTSPFISFSIGNAVLPSAAAKELFELLAEADGADIRVDPALRGKTIAPETGIVARVEPIDDLSIRLSLQVCPIVGGATYPPGEGPKELIGRREAGRVYVDRNLEAEIEAASAVTTALELPAAVAAPFTWQFDDPEEMLDLLSRINEVPGLVVEWPKGSAPLRVLRAGTPRLKITARQKQHWFLIGGMVTVDDMEVPLKDLLAAVRRRHRYVRLRKGEFLILEKVLYRKLAEFSDIATAEHNSDIAVSASSVPFIDEQLKTLQFHGGSGWNHIRERIAEAAVISPEVPAEFHGVLRSYQKEGFGWMCRLAHWAGGACLADDMGLGKTLQTLALLLWRKREIPSLVVSPMSVCHNWMSEAAKFAPTLDVRMFHGNSRADALAGLTGQSVLVTSYDTLAANADQLAAIPFDVMVLDEAQMVKNALSKRARAVAGMQASFRVALTGTPVENHLGDLWSIFHSIIPGLMGSYDQFRRRFAVPIERDADPRARELLRSLIGPFILRRTKAEVLPELPPRIETIREVELHNGHMALYNAERQKIIEALLDMELPAVKRRFAALAGLTRLRRLACHPRLIDELTSLGSAKMEHVVEVIQDLVAQDQRALVFSQFTSHLALLQNELQRIGVGYLYLDGKTSAAKRKALVAQWQTGVTPLFVISLKAGGAGLNLTGADYVLHLDPWWNPAAEDQATDRTHRIGQTKTVTVVRFISCDTVEQGVVTLHTQKRDLAEAILSGSKETKTLSPDELIALIRGE